MGRFWEKVLNFPLTRIVVAGSMVLITVSLAQAIVVIPGNAFGLKTNPLTAIPYYVLFLIASVSAATGSYRLYVRLIEKRPIPELATEGAWVEGGVGALFGISLIAATLAILGLLGLYTLTGYHGGMAGLPAVVESLANDISGAFVEEILLRAIVFRICEEVMGSWWAIVISALLFTALHLFDTQPSMLSALLIGVEATLLLCAAWMLTRRLWLAVGIHAGWDFAQGALFGVGASGQGQPLSLVQGQLTGSPLFTGGAAGVEASIVAFVVVLAASLYLLKRARQRGHILPAAWQAAKAPDVGSL